MNQEEAEHKGRKYVTGQYGNPNLGSSWWETGSDCHQAADETDCCWVGVQSSCAAAVLMCANLFALMTVIYCCPANWTAKTMWILR